MLLDLVVGPVNLPRRIPPCRRRDADPGPISSIILISIGVLIIVAVVALVRRFG